MHLHITIYTSDISCRSIRELFQSKMFRSFKQHFQAPAVLECSSVCRKWQSGRMLPRELKWLGMNRSSNQRVIVWSGVSGASLRSSSVLPWGRSGICKSPPPLPVQHCSFHGVVCLSLLDVIQHHPPLPSSCSFPCYSSFYDCSQQSFWSYDMPSPSCFSSPDTRL